MELRLARSVQSLGEPRCMELIRHHTSPIKNNTRLGEELTNFDADLDWQYQIKGLVCYDFNSVTQEKQTDVGEYHSIKHPLSKEWRSEPGDISQTDGF